MFVKLTDSFLDDHLFYVFIKFLIEFLAIISFLDANVPETHF